MLVYKLGLDGNINTSCCHVAVYGTVPSFVFSTATSANPCDHCMVMSGAVLLVYVLSFYALCIMLPF